MTVPMLMKIGAWGDGLTRFNISQRPKLIPYLREHLGVESFPDHPWTWEPKNVGIPPSSLSESFVREMRSILGAEDLSQDPIVRFRHATGKSYKDLLRVRLNKVESFPDAVVFPRDEEVLARLLSLCSREGVAVVPFGGGTSVVGGVDPLKGRFSSVLTLNMQRMNRVLQIDEASQTATIEAGILGPDMERQLNDRGYTLGHFPQSFEFSSLGGWLATRSSGQNSICYGGIEKMVVALRMVTERGIYQTPLVPRHACGPDLKELFLGTEGTFGIFSSAVLHVHRVPERKEYFLVAFPSFRMAAEAVRQVVQNKVPVAMLRLSDEDETHAMFHFVEATKINPVKQMVETLGKSYLKLRGIFPPKMAALMVGLEGSREQISERRAWLKQILGEHRYMNLGSAPGRKWLKDRFFLPYFRDDCLDYGLFLDTFETATEWSNLFHLYETVRGNIAEVFRRDGLKLKLYTHVSHLYQDGAALYFTILGQQGKDPLAQWHRVKEIANTSVLGSGGVISHHHGIGVDHKNHQYGDALVKRLFRQVKHDLDPEGILNPEKWNN
ncbi:MAG: FAD-binding oxidoreductase [Deltaproteobacteria bacterium]|nr:FAD-binding oxidoreductase [Deltaproteobacteria bacterium]